MSEIEEALIESFLWKLEMGAVPLSPKGATWNYLRGFEAGGSARTDSLNKVDLLVEGGREDTERVAEPDEAERQGRMSPGEHKNISSMLWRVDGARVWIVEAKHTKVDWDALGQALFHQALVSRLHPNLNVMGSVVVYPAKFGRDEMMEYAVEVLSGSPLRLSIFIMPIDVSVWPPNRRAPSGLDPFA